MKAEISKDGCVTITSQTVAEAYALYYIFPMGVKIDSNKIIIDCSILEPEGEGEREKMK